MRSHKFCMNLRAIIVMCMLCLMTTTAFAAVGPSVNVMPDGDTIESSYTWAGNSLSIWGNVKWGDSTTGTYKWDINNDGTVDYTGSVTNAKDIKIVHSYTAAGHYEAKLTVTDSNGFSDSAIVRIYVKPAVDKQAKINLAIEKGLKWLYLSQQADGGIWDRNYANSAGVETAAAVLAFENKNHKPVTKDQNGDGVIDATDRALWEKGRVYAETVHKGLNYMLTRLAAFNVGAPYDSNGNGVYVADMYLDHATYKSGMYMMALIGAGDVASGAPELVATAGTSGVFGKTYRKLVEDMVDYCDYSQYHNATYGGGWIYNAGEGYGDNSASQWPAIGMDAAQMIWGVPVRQAIKDLNFAWINYSQYFTGYEPYAYYGALGYRSKGEGQARTASGICQLSFQGKLKNDPRILAAAKWLSTQSSMNGWDYGRTSYNMYAIAKGARIAKIDTNGDGIGDTYSEIQLLNGWDWYETLSTELLNTQYAGGYWYNWYPYTVSTLDTAWAVEILTKNVFNLRPIAKLSVSPNPTPASSDVTFDACASSHQDPAKILKNWQVDVNGDGTYELTGTFPACTATYKYPDTNANYSKTAKLQVTDNQGATAEDQITVNIVTGNVAPVAIAGGPYNGVIGSPITFDGSASYDPNSCTVGPGCLGDSIIKYEWDLDGNGTYETSSGTSPIVQKTWTTPYSGVIGLKVTDKGGLSSTAQVNAQVFVVDLWPENYVKVSEKRISIYVYEYTYKFDMRNRGNGAATNVKTTLDTKPAQVTVVDGTASFGNILGGTVKTSTDTFSYRTDRRYPVADFQLRWKLEYDYIGSDGLSHHQSFVDFPLR